MLELEQNPWMLLEGRIAYRKAWVMRHAPAKPKVDPRTYSWEIEYDEEHNFAHMGTRYVDGDWGSPKTKPKPIQKNNLQKAAWLSAVGSA